MKIKALELEQNGRKLYLATMKVEQLWDKTNVKTDYWGPDNQHGYQRNISPTRAKSFARYIRKAKGIAPNSILLSVREDVKFKSDNGNYGTLEIPSTATLWLVDGQHRKAGFNIAAEEDASYLNFLVPVVIMPTNLNSEDHLDPVYEEAKQFVTINRTQKGVRSDLAERFLITLSRREDASTIEELPREITRGIEWVPKAIHIAEILNKKHEPWKAKIKLPNQPRGDTTVSQKSFTDSLKAIITNAMFNDYTPDEIAKMLSLYWQTWYELIPAAFDDPTEHNIQKTTGCFVLHRLFLTVASYTGGQFNKNKIKEIISTMTLGTDGVYWTASGEAGLAGTSQRSFGLLYDRLRNNLEEMYAQDEERRTRPFEIG